MATPQEIRTASTAVNNLSEHVRLCEDIAKALIDVGWPLYSGWPLHSLGFFFGSTDHQRARNQVIQGCHTVLADIRRMRRTILSPDLVRVEAQVSRMLDCCSICPNKNHSQQQQGEPFTCLIQKQAQASKDGFRFQIDEKGQIIEQK